MEDIHSEERKNLTKCRRKQCLIQISQRERLQHKRTQTARYHLWPIMTLLSSLPCILFVTISFLVFVHPSPIALAAASETEDPIDLSEVTTYQSIEEIDDSAIEEIVNDHSKSLLINLLKTQNLLVKATQDVASATKRLLREAANDIEEKDMSVALVASTSTAAINELKESHRLLEEQILNLTNQFESARTEIEFLNENKKSLEERHAEMTDKVQELETTIEKLRDEVSTDRREPNKLTNAECPDKFEWVGEDCIYLGRGDQRRTWHEARGICHSLGGDLAVPSNLTLLASRLRGETMTGVWVGATDSAGKGRWFWLVSGASIAEDYWAEGFPKNDGGWTNCGALVRDKEYRMVEEACSFFYYYICQIFPKGYWQANQV